jgi:hypothetical protein
VELQRNPQATVAYSHSMMIDGQGQPMVMTWHPHGSSGEVKTFDGYTFVRQRMLVDNCVYNASMVVFRKSACINIPTDFQRFRYCGDWLFWTYVCMHGQVIEVCRQLNRYRQHTNKVTAHSKMNGGMWRNLGGIMRTFIHIFHLSYLQKHCLRGRWSKRFTKEALSEHMSIRNEYSDIFGGGMLDIILYEVGKLFGFLKN